MQTEQKLLYREVQRPRNIWYLLSVLLFAGLMWVGFIMQIFFDIEIGTKPAPDAMWVVLWLIFGVAFPIFMIFVIKLIVEVRIDGMYVRFVPFHQHARSFLFREINQIEQVTYNSLKRFGGWGVRYNFQNEVGYNLNGSQGI